MLFRGLRLAKAGWRVTFIDQADRVGGGWRTIDASGLTGVETGVHLFERRASSIAALRSLFAPDELTADLGHGQVGGRRIGLGTARVLLYAGLFAKAVRRGSAERAGHALSKLAQSLRPRRLPLLYPVGGVAALLAGLEHRLGDGGAEFRLNTRVEEVELTPAGVCVRAGDAVIYADRFVFSSRAHVPISGDDALWRELRPSEVVNLLMVVPDEAVWFDGYVEIFANQTVKRARCFRGEISVLVVQLRSDRISDEHALAELARVGLIRPGTIARETRLERFSFTTLPTRPAMRLAAKSGGRLEFVRTVDFSDEDHSLP